MISPCTVGWSQAPANKITNPENGEEFEIYERMLAWGTFDESLTLQSVLFQFRDSGNNIVYEAVVSPPEAFEFFWEADPTPESGWPAFYVPAVAEQGSWRVVLYAEEEVQLDLVSGPVE